jgi:hypothetical protein
VGAAGRTVVAPDAAGHTVVTPGTAVRTVMATVTAGRAVHICVCHIRVCGLRRRRDRADQVADSE